MINEEKYVIENNRLQNTLNINIIDKDKINNKLFFWYFPWEMVYEPFG